MCLAPAVGHGGPGVQALRPSRRIAQLQGPISMCRLGDSAEELADMQEFDGLVTP
jgi:hypothetical protein